METSQKVIRWIKNRVANNWSADILITGERGNGKSWAGIRLAELIDPSFTSDRIIFSNKDYISSYHDKKLSKGQAIVYDEVGVELASTKVMQKEVKDALDELLTNRVENTIAIFTTPSIKDVPDKLRRNMSLWIQVYKRNPKYSIAYPRYCNDLQLFGTRYVNIRNSRNKKKLQMRFLPPSSALVNPYEEKKREYRKELGKRLKGEVPTGTLTPLQQEVLGLYNAGYTQMQIAEKLGRGQPTISDHLKAAKKKGYVPITPSSYINEVKGRFNN